MIALQGYWLAGAALALHDVMRIPVVFHVRSIYSEPVLGQEAPELVEQAYFRQLESWAMTRAERLIAVSEYIARLCVVRGSQMPRTHVIPNGLNVDRYAGEWKPNDRQTVLYVGRLGPEKGLETLLHALGRR